MASKKKTCVVIMPYNNELNLFYDKVIYPIVNGLNINCQRADRDGSGGILIYHIIELIKKADFLIADLTGDNPNVFYELGLAHLFGKKVILISSSHQTLPTDLQNWQFIHYRTAALSAFEKNLKNRITSKTDDYRDILHGNFDTEFPPPNENPNVIESLVRTMLNENNTHDERRMAYCDICEVSLCDEVKNLLIEKGLMDKHPYVRERVALLLQKFPFDSYIEEHLIKLLNDESWGVRLHTIESIKYFKMYKAKEKLAGIARSDSKDTVRKLAEECYKEFKNFEDRRLNLVKIPPAR